MKLQEESRTAARARALERLRRAARATGAVDPERAVRGLAQTYALGDLVRALAAEAS